LNQLSEENQGQEMDNELQEEIKRIEKKISQEQVKYLLTGEYDKGKAVLSIFSGAGGREAEDWTAMLSRMYQRYAERSGFKTKILARSFGEPGGPEGRIALKSIVMEIDGRYAYGYLKRESGVHRLVRISPFSEQHLRHTSFALVEVLPELTREKEAEIEIDPKDLRIDTFRASGPGGQHVNKRESAIRITHLPTGMKVSCQLERLQGSNRDQALKLLKARLYQAEQKKEKKALAKFKEDPKAAWGKQIRSYVIQPYQMVKDYRTKVETSQIDEVLDGSLEKFIEAEIRLND
jgi:peptide chain release factor 2